MNDLQTLSELFAIESTRINKEFDNYYYSYFVALYDGNITESVSDPFGASIKKFFTNLITAIRNYINKFKNYLGKSSREAGYITTLNTMEKNIRKAKDEGKTKVTMPDYKFIRNEYNAMCKDLKSYAKKFVKMKYKSTIEIDRDLDSFMKVSNAWDKRMEKAVEKKKTINIDDALRFVENEKSGYTHVFDTLNDAITQINDIKHVAEETAARTSTLGSDIIPKHVNFLRRIANAISSKVTKFAAKTIAVNVLLFA